MLKLHNKSNSLALVGLCLLSVTSVVTSCPTILLSTGNTIEQGETVYDAVGRIALVQQFGGNLQVYTGEPGSLECLVWESGICETPSNDGFYSSKLQGDGNLVTKKRDNSGKTSFPWAANLVAGAAEYIFVVACDGRVGIYDSALVSTPLWEEQGNSCGLTQPPPPTTCRRTVLMRENDQVRSDRVPLQGDGAYILQRDDGAVVVQEGTPDEPGEIIWQSCSNGNPTASYLTGLQPDSQFITRPTSDLSTFVWKRDNFTPDTTAPWELALECDGDEYGSLVISDPTGANVAWQTDLRPTCDNGVCTSATVLLDMKERIQSGTPKSITYQNEAYTLLQRSDGNLRLWKGSRGSFACIAWQSDETRTSTNAQAYTVMQNDGNLVSYWRQGTDSYVPIWDTETRSDTEGSFTFVIEECTAGQTGVAVYENNSIVDSDARLLWRVPLVETCVPPTRRRALLRGAGHDVLESAL
jgi:hypothetical protein